MPARDMRAVITRLDLRKLSDETKDARLQAIEDFGQSLRPFLSWR